MNRYLVTHCSYVIITKITYLIGTLKMVIFHKLNCNLQTFFVIIIQYSHPMDFLLQHGSCVVIWPRLCCPHAASASRSGTRLQSLLRHARLYVPSDPAGLCGPTLAPYRGCAASYLGSITGPGCELGAREPRPAHLSPRWLNGRCYLHARPLPFWEAAPRSNGLQRTPSPPRDESTGEQTAEMRLFVLRGEQRSKDTELWQL